MLIHFDSPIVLIADLWTLLKQERMLFTPVLFNTQKSPSVPLQTPKQGAKLQ